MEDQRFISSPREEDYKDCTEPRTETEPHESEEYYDLPENLGARSMIWSVISLIFSILSVAFCPIYYLGIAFSLVAVGAGAVSRHNLGYFDKKTLFGITVGIFGFIFGICSMIMDLTGILDGLYGK
jgi:hypothetical protein